MLRNYVFAGWFVTIYLAIYAALAQFQATFNIAFGMFIFGPLLMVWLVYCVLRKKDYGIRDLGEDEFGYQDKANSELGT